MNQPTQQTTPNDSPKGRKAGNRIHVPQWFRKWIWFWLFLMSLVALAGYSMMVLTGKWTPDHLFNILPGVFA